MGLYPGAAWRGPVPNESPGQMGTIFGLVLHIEEGTETSANNWFHNPGAKASAHFGNPKGTGPLDEWVDMADMAWAEVNGNPNWFSIEHEGVAGDSLTAFQFERVAQLFAFIHTHYNVPLQITDSPSIPGLGWHGMGGAWWGGHYGCPGQPIVDARGAILARAAVIVGGSTSGGTPMSMFCTDPETGGIWATDANGDLYCPAGPGGATAPFVQGLNQHPDFHAGAAESGGTEPCVGIAAAKGTDGHYGIAYFTPNPGGAFPYNEYRFNRDGSG